MPQDIEKANAPKVPAKSINLGLNNLIDLDGLPDDQAAELQRQHAAGMVELNRKANEAKIDVGALGGTLGTINDEASKATQSNVSITVTHRQKTTLGETEVVIGNTERAAAGKLSMSASGLTDRLPLLIGIVAAALIIIALIVTRH
jgi:hypothetical protein